jgi:hypothetical protein
VAHLNFDLLFLQRVLGSRSGMIADALLLCMAEIFLWIGLLDGVWRFVSGCFREY